MTSNEQTPSVTFAVKNKVRKKHGEMEGTAALLLISNRVHDHENGTYAERVRGQHIHLASSKELLIRHFHRACFLEKPISFVLSSLPLLISLRLIS